VFDEFSDKAVRNREQDRTFGGEPCRAFDLPLGPSLSTTSHVKAARKTLKAKTLLLLDRRDRVRYCENQVLLDGAWVAYRKAEVAYDVEIDPDRFTPTFGTNVVVSDTIDLVTERAQKADPVDPVIARLSKGIETRQEAYYDLVFTYEFTVTSIRQLADDLKHWIPEWPPHTSVSDPITGLGVMVPWTVLDKRPEDKKEGE